MLNIESLYFADTAHINMHANIQIQTHTHAYTHTPLHTYSHKNSESHTGMLTHPDRLLHIQPPRTPELYMLLYTPHVPCTRHMYAHTHTHTHIAWHRPAPPLTWRHMSLACYLGSPQMVEGHLHRIPSTHLHVHLAACGCSRGWCTGATSQPAP